MGIDELFKKDAWIINSIEYAVINERHNLLKYVLSLDEVQSKYKDDKLLHRLIHHSFFKCANVKIVDLVLRKLNITNDKMIEFVNYKDDKKNIVGQVIYHRTLNILKKLFEEIGQLAFIKNVLISDGMYNRNALEYAIMKKKIDIIQYLFSFDDIQKEYATNKDLIWRCVWYMSGGNYDESVASYLMKEFNLNEEKLRELQKFKCKKPESKYYWNKTIDDKAIGLLLNGKK